MKKLRHQNNMDEIKTISSIRFPNTIDSDDQHSYTVGFNGVEKIVSIMKAGEMSGIGWFEIWVNSKVFAEIKESVCDIYYMI
jgi:hypothetical protein